MEVSHTPEATLPHPLPPSEVSALRRWARRVLHGLTIFSAGVLAHELLNSPRVPSLSFDPAREDRVEDLSPKEQRYRDKLCAVLQGMEERWPKALQGVQVRKGGAVRAGLAQRQAASDGQLSLEHEGKKLRVLFTREGFLQHLTEEQGGTVTELWPEHKDLRLTLHKDDRIEYAWWTAGEALHGVRSGDGKLQSFFIEGEGIIDPKAPPAMLIQKLSTPHRAYLFQRIHAIYEDYPIYRDGTYDLRVAGSFLKHYRLSLAEWQAFGYRKGCCNTYAEATCEVLAKSPHEHYPMHILTYWPRDPEKRLTEAWHQTAAFPMGSGAWCIVDGSMERLTYVSSPEAYGKEWEWELATTPILGRFSWQPEHRGPFFRFLQHIHIPEKKGKGASEKPVAQVRLPAQFRADKRIRAALMHSSEVP